MPARAITTSRQKPHQAILAKARGQMGLEEFPFESRLSVAPLIKYWLDNKENRNLQIALVAKEVKKYVENHPDIMSSYTSTTTFLKTHGSFLDILFSSIFPPALSQTMFGYVAPPFIREPFYTTRAMQEMLSDPKVQVQYEQYSEFDKMPFSIRACFIILQKHYRVEIDHIMPFLFSMNFGDDRLEKFYKTISFLDYLNVKTKKPAPQIQSSTIDYLLENTKDTKLWLETFSPDVFYFEGMFLALMNDVTEVETLSRLRKILLQPKSILEVEHIKYMQHLTRIYLNLPDIDLGIFALDFPADGSIAHRYKVRFPLLKNINRWISGDNQNSVYQRACHENQMQIVSDLGQNASRSQVEEQLLQKGYRSLLIVPLWDKSRKIIGMVEFGSPKPYAFTHVKKLKVKELLPLYDIAMEEGRAFIENKIQNIIQDQYTNIHPSILWKFTESAFNFLEQSELIGDMATLEPIVFKDVYPLFGQIDINNSTEIRNKAIRTDLLENLILLNSVLETAFEKSQFHLLKKYAFDVNKNLELLKTNFNATLESSTAELLLKHIHPLLRQTQIQHPALFELIDAYFRQLDPELEIVYEQRRLYEESVNTLNHTIARYLQHQEFINQQIIPHYFEKYITDGVEYDIYIGQSLLKHDTFTIHHLENLRLWQLKSMVEMARNVNNSMPKLPIDLSLSYLIFVYNDTLSIQFRMEEKHFDVDGAYHVRYEILKKRIDKATIGDGKERLTQKNKIVIVFTQEKDKQEYMENIQYLINENLLKDDVEDLEVDQLQGVNGLKALRVGMNI